MKKIETEYNETHNYLLLNVVGKISADDIIEIIQSLKVNHPNAARIWDVRDADLSLLDKEASKRILEEGKLLTQGKSRTKVAILGGEKTSKMFVWLYTALAEVTGSKIDYEFKTSLTEAVAWLKSND